jgi:uncharacterized protein (DUF433 family)
VVRSESRTVLTPAKLMHFGGMCAVSLTHRNDAMKPDDELRRIEVTAGVCAGRPRIAGCRIRVQDIVVWTEEGETPEAIVADFPQLTLADVHAALAYYLDHQQQIDEDVRSDAAFSAKMRAKSKSNQNSHRGLGESAPDANGGRNDEPV